MDALSRRIHKSHAAVWASIDRKVPSGAGIKPKIEEPAKERIAQAIYREGSRWRNSARKYARDISFHLVDWYTDLEQLRAVIRHPHKFTDKEIAAIVATFMVHAPHHIAAAHKIHEEEAIPDVFELGIHKDGPPQKSACLGPPMPRKNSAKRKGARSKK